MRPQYLILGKPPANAESTRSLETEHPPASDQTIKHRWSILKFGQGKLCQILENLLAPSIKEIYKVSAPLSLYFPRSPESISVRKLVLNRTRGRLSESAYLMINPINALCLKTHYLYSRIFQGLKRSRTREKMSQSEGNHTPKTIKRKLSTKSGSSREVSPFSGHTVAKTSRQPREDPQTDSNESGPPGSTEQGGKLGTQEIIDNQDD